MRLMRFSLFAAAVAVAGALAAFSVPTVEAIPPIPKAKAEARPHHKHPRGHKAPSAEVLAARHAAAFRRHDHRMKHLPTATPAQFDCATMGWVGPVRDQGQCGSCWDVSGCDCITSAFIKAGLAKNDGSFNISPQYFLDQCAYRNMGCGGDDSINVLDWAKQTGAPSEADYGPYTAGQGRCRFNPGTKLYKLADWGYCTPGQQQGIAATQDIKNALVLYGPISTGIAADSSWDSVTSNGVIRFERATVNDVDHDVQITGWDDAKQIPGAPAPGAFKVKNQWGRSWGADGYCWIAYGSHAIGSEAAWATVAPLPPPPPPVPPAPPTPVPPVPPAPPAPVIVSHGTVTIPAQTITVGYYPFHQNVTIPAQTVPVSVTSGPAGVQVDAEKGLSPDVLFALFKLYEDIQASGQGKLIADFKDVMAAIRSRSGVLAALEQLGTDLVAVGTDPAILADLLRIATDLGVPVPLTSPLHGKPCCGK